MICPEVENQFLKFWLDFNNQICLYVNIWYMFLFINYILSVALINAFRDIEYTIKHLSTNPIRHVEHTDGQSSFVPLSHTY